MAKPYFLALVTIVPPSPEHCDSDHDVCRFAPDDGSTECHAFGFDLVLDDSGRLLRCDRCLEAEAADRAPIRGVS